MISGSADAEHVERWIECVRTANRSDPGVVTERGESDERDDAEMRAVLELDRRVSAAKTEYEGDSGLVRSVEQVVEAEPGESVVVHGIAISFGPPGPVNGFLLTTSLWRCLVDPESPATFRVGLPEGQSVATGGVVRVVGRVTREGGRPVMRDAEVTEVDD